jgi:hypothetical protein
MKNGFPAPNKELAKTKNNHLTGKAPYKFESTPLQQRVRCEPRTDITKLKYGASPNGLVVPLASSAR